MVCFLVYNFNSTDWNIIYRGKIMKANFETERLIIRNLVPGDYEQAYKWCGCPIVNKYMIMDGF